MGLPELEPVTAIRPSTLPAVPAQKTAAEPATAGAVAAPPPEPVPSPLPLRRPRRRLDAPPPEAPPPAVEQAAPANVNVSVRVDSPGDNGSVDQANAAAAVVPAPRSSIGRSRRSIRSRYRPPRARPRRHPRPSPASEPDSSWDWNWTWNCADPLPAPPAARRVRQTIGHGIGTGIATATNYHSEKYRRANNLAVSTDGCAVSAGQYQHLDSDQQPGERRSSPPVQHRRGGAARHDPDDPGRGGRGPIDSGAGGAVVESVFAPAVPPVDDAPDLVGALVEEAFGLDDCCLMRPSRAVPFAQVAAIGRCGRRRMRRRRRRVISPLRPGSGPPSRSRSGSTQASVAATRKARAARSPALTVRPAPPRQTDPAREPALALGAAGFAPLTAPTAGSATSCCSSSGSGSSLLSPTPHARSPPRCVRAART